MTTKMTQAEIDQLIELNRQRDPLNDKLQERAEELFKLWERAEPAKHGYRSYQSASLTDYGYIRILFGTGCSCSGRGDDDYTEIPQEALIEGSDWESEMNAKISASRK